MGSRPLGRAFVRIMEDGHDQGGWSWIAASRHKLAESGGGGEVYGGVDAVSTGTAGARAGDTWIRRW